MNRSVLFPGYYSSFRFSLFSKPSGWAHGLNGLGMVFAFLLDGPPGKEAARQKRRSSQKLKKLKNGKGVANGNFFEYRSEVGKLVFSQF